MTEEKIAKQAEEYTKEKYCLYCKELRFCNGNKCSKYDDTVIDFIAGAKWGMKEICKKILEETKKMWQEDSDYFSDLEGIIKVLGVQI